MDDTFDDRPTALWTPVDDGDAPTQVVSFGAPQKRPMPPVQAGPPAPDVEPERAEPVPVPVVPDDVSQGAAEPPAAGPLVLPPSTPTPTAAESTSPVEVPVPAPTPDDPDATAMLRPAMATALPDEPPQVQAAPAAVAEGDLFAGRYRLEQQLARRGGTLTWRAFDQKLSRAVLVHVLDHDDPRTTGVLEAARAAAVATDSRFLRVLDAVAGEAPGAPSLVVCEFAPGQSLERLLQHGPLSALEAAWVARELADALGAMHAEGLFHQRINPDTVVITATGNVKIVGFLIEQAMHPSATDGELAWSEREAADVRAVGKLLYASLVTRWPTEPDQVVDEDGEPRVTWGMPPAPTDGRGWLTPRQIRSGVSPALDVICDQVLSDSPRYGEPPLRTAGQVVQALNKVLGTADAAADLERRLRYPVLPVDGDAPDDTIPGQPLAIAEPAEEPAQTTATMASVDDDAPAGRERTGGRERAEGRTAHEEGWRTASTPNRGRAERRTARALRRDPSHGARPRPRRWLGLLVALVALVAVLGIVKALSGRDSGSSPGGDPAAPAVLEVKGVDDFDPTADGGNGEENPGQASLATDKNPSTAWQSVTYLNDPALGRLKPGVGLVLDLGSVQRVGSVQLTLQGQPTAVELRVPASDAADRAPSTSGKQWKVVAKAPTAGTSATLTPSAPVETRYLLVYLTKLPRTEGNHYRGGIAEVEVRS